jgi:phasin
MATNTARGAKAALQQTEKVIDAQADIAEKAARSATSAARNMADAAFTAPSFEVPELFRSLAEQSLTQTRDAYGRIKAATEEATDIMEQSFENTRESVREVQFKALDAARENAEATFDLFRQLLGVTSVSDAIQLQTAFARERFEAFVDYSKDVQNTLTKVTSEAGKPAKALFERTLSQTKAA